MNANRRSFIPPALLLILAIVLPACTPAPVYTDKDAPTRAARKTTPVVDGTLQPGQVLTGFASYYGDKFAGRQTANGEIFNPSHMTAAHKSLPFGTKLKVTLIATGKSVIVRINDRGPFIKNRFLDLSEGAAERIGLIQSGVGYVEAEVLEVGGS